MARRPMTHSEELVGRRLPPPASNGDQYLSRYVHDDGSFRGRMTPNESWLRPSHLKARRSGFLKASLLSFGRGAEIWFLSERGEREAVAARQRLMDAEAARHRWCLDFVAAQAARSDVELGRGGAAAVAAE